MSKLKTTTTDATNYDKVVKIIGKNVALVGLTFGITTGSTVCLLWQGLNFIVPPQNVKVLSSGQAVTERNNYADLIKFILMVIFSGVYIPANIVFMLLVAAFFNRKVLVGDGKSNK